MPDTGLLAPAGLDEVSVSDAWCGCGKRRQVLVDAERYGAVLPLFAVRRHFRLKARDVMWHEDA